jgi:heat-inducible transcriptional repressor
MKDTTLANSSRQFDADILNERSREVLRQIVDSYLQTGEPVGSRNLARVLPLNLSPASIRNVMSDLEHLGLIASPHTSAGRLPTQSGLRLFVDGLLEVGDLTDEERNSIKAQISGHNANNFDALLSEAGEMISGLSHCAGVVLADKQVERLKHVEFVPLAPQKALVILVGESGAVENRVLELPPGLPPSTLIDAGNYLNAHVQGLTITEAIERIQADEKKAQAELDELTQRIIKAGFAEWSGTLDDRRSLIVRGRSNLLKEVTAQEDLDRIGLLFDDLESKRDLMQILSNADRAEGVKIFIGSESKMFSLSGSSLIAAPFHDEERKVVGVIGIIGPTRLNYARIIPMVDYTAKLMSKLLT